jgi:hypothetical protein
MRTIENLVTTPRAAEIFRQEKRRHLPRLGEVIALHFMSSFTNADGATVADFAPGYTIDYVADRDFGDSWLLAHLPDGTPFRFMPKFEWRPDETYVLDRASGYTFSIGPAAP